MKQRRSRNPRAKQVACTISAAALMLGISPAATVAMHFQVNYCGYSGYSGCPVTDTAFGIPANGWQNLTPMSTGYASCKLTAPPYGYTLNEVVSTSTSTGGLNPLPQGSLNVNWFGPTANFSGFGGYVESPPYYNIIAVNATPIINPGEEQIYASFLRDGINFGPPGGADNTSGVGGYSVDITGLKSVFAGSFVVELIASSDSMQKLTNAFVIDATTSTTNPVTYPNTPQVLDATGAPWAQGHGGGLSTVSGQLNTDHLKIMSNLPQHGGTGFSPTGFDNAGTISGFIITDMPVVTMSPRSVSGGLGDTVTLNPYAIGVPPLAYQWRKNGSAISGATNSSLVISGLNVAKSGNYDFIVANSFGSVTSSVAVVSIDTIKLTPGASFVADANPANPERNGKNNGATWLAGSSDGATARSGVMQFTATNANGISATGSTNFDSMTGTYSFWMRSAGIDPHATGSLGAALFGRPGNSLPTDLVLLQQDGGGIYFNAPGIGLTAANGINSGANVADNHWHFIVLTYDQSAAGGATLYIDGSLDTTNANLFAWTTPVGVPLQIGFTSDTSLRDYNGLLDDVRVYNRQLTAAEVSSIYTTDALIDTNALQMQLNFTTPPASGFTLTWSAVSAVLQSAAVAPGPYNDVAAVGSPYYIIPKSGQKFYRYRYTPQSLVSNPYLM